MPSNLEDLTRGQEGTPLPLILSDLSEAAQSEFETAVNFLLENFSYVTEAILPPGHDTILRPETDSASDDDDDLPGCECEGGPCNQKSIDCACILDHGYYYDDQGDLSLDQLPKRYAIYECCSTCSCICDTSINKAKTVCRNKVTQQGLTTRCSVRWTNDKGFGLFTEENIPKGSFLCCYAGEVISSSEAKGRWAKQEKGQLSNYILVLKEVIKLQGQQETLKTTIDGRLFGNVSHFLNHACPPLTTHVVLPVRTVGTILPRPAFFAVRDIKAGEELTWDYHDAGGESWLFSNSSAYERNAALPAADAVSRTACKCGSPLCRHWMAYDPSL